MGYLIFDVPGRYEDGYEPFNLTPQSIEANQAKVIVYLTNRDIDARGSVAFPRYITIGKRWYSKLISYDGSDSVDIRDIVECGIRIETPES